MNKIACQYAIIRFAPFVETEEFANVGIVLIAPKQGYFNFRLELKRYSRVTHFFDGVDAKFYRNTLRHLKNELARFVGFFPGQNQGSALAGPELLQLAFKDIVREREAIVRFSEVRTVLAEDPKQVLDELFGFYVHRSFGPKKYMEALMEDGVKELLTKAKVNQRFGRQKIGDDLYHATFPFVRKAGRDTLQAIIKPLHLGHDEPTRIIEHGDAWLNRIRRLQGRFLQPERVLFALAAPDKQHQDCMDAYKDVEQALVQANVQIVPYTAKAEITRFAQT